MKAHNIRSIFVGVFILAAYGILVSAATQSKAIVLVADIISGLSVVGIAALMFPLFKKVGSAESFTYLLLKIAEGGLMIAGGILYLFDSQQYLRANIYEGVHLYIFIVSGFLFYHLLLKSKLIPRFISIWGMVGIFALTLINTSKLVGIDLSALQFLLILIITNEAFLAGWLMFKGFKVVEE